MLPLLSSIGIRGASIYGDSRKTGGRRQASPMRGQAPVRRKPVAATKLRAEDREAYARPRQPCKTMNIYPIALQAGFPTPRKRSRNHDAMRGTDHRTFLVCRMLYTGFRELFLPAVRA